MRRDSLGRQIGPNPWRDYVTDEWRCARHAWWLTMETTTGLYPAEVREYAEHTPGPLLRDFMVGLSPVWQQYASARALLAHCAHYA